MPPAAPFAVQRVLDVYSGLSGDDLDAVAERLDAAVAAATGSMLKLVT